MKKVDGLQADIIFDDLKENVIATEDSFKNATRSAKEVKDINYIKECDAYDLLDDKLKEVCDYRLKYPEESLTSLSKIMTLETGNSITKSGLHHRFNKIKLLAERLRNK